MGWAFCTLPHPWAAPKKPILNRVNAWCQLKGHTCLNRPAAETATLFKYIWPFSGQQGVKGLKRLVTHCWFWQDYQMFQLINNQQPWRNRLFNLNSNIILLHGCYHEANRRINYLDETIKNSLSRPKFLVWAISGIDLYIISKHLCIGAF